MVPEIGRYVAENDAPRRAAIVRMVCRQSRSQLAADLIPPLRPRLLNLRKAGPRRGLERVYLFRDDVREVGLDRKRAVEVTNGFRDIATMGVALPCDRNHIRRLRRDGEGALGVGKCILD